MEVFNYQDYKNELLSDRKIKNEYERLKPDFTLSKEIIGLLKNKKMTQKKLANEIGSSLPAIARLESGNYKNLFFHFKEE